jgi:radical SAM superfamily enzyme YgiQ (UPF0313 family)
MNAREDWVCERAFCPWQDMEAQLRLHEVPLYSLESFTPLSDFDVLGFTLQYEICTSNLLTMLDLGGIPIHAQERTMDDPLVIAGGPCAQNPEPLAPFIDVFVTGDGEPSLPAICDLWLKLKEAYGARSDTGNIKVASATQSPHRGEAGGDRVVRDRGAVREREEAIAELARRLPFVYAPRFYEPEYYADGRLAALCRTRPDMPETIEPAVIDDLEGTPLPSRPIVPLVECVHDRISIEIMRGCPWQCRFCQSTVIKRPLRFRSVETIVAAALASYRSTGFNELSILSLSTSDYPHFEELVQRLNEVFIPLDVSVSIPSLRVNEQLKSVARLIPTTKRSGLTLAPEVARDDMREQIRKKIKNQDLFDGCREAFRNGFQHVKLYFMCGLPGERTVDLDGILDLSETISRIGREERNRPTRVVASVSNFVPKAHTPYQWNGMQTPEYFRAAHHHLRRNVRQKSVQIKCHDVETTLLEGVLSRGDRRVARAAELAWRRGSRMDSWREHFDAGLWRGALADAEIDIERTVHEAYPLDARLPWDHLNVKKGRAYLEKEHHRAVVQLSAMADAK